MFRSAPSGLTHSLMNLRRRFGLVSKRNQRHAVSSRLRVAPAWFSTVDVLSDGEGAVIAIRATSAKSVCPSCGAISDRVHSRYPRRLADLPIAGMRVVLVLHARRFSCGADRCARRIFTERFDDSILEPWARRTARLDQIVPCLALALGGRPAASFSRRLSMPVSNDTLLRAVRRRGSSRVAPPAIIGIDDWAWRRNQDTER
jgi:transposase